MARIKSKGATIEKIDIQMTPMIDIVFQLLTFFLMTFKVASPEGDFNLKLPKEERSSGPSNTQTEMITLGLKAKANGDLAMLQIESNPPVSGPQAFTILHNSIVKMVNVARGAGQDEPEIQIDADDILRYENIVQTISAVSGQVDSDGNVIPLVKKVKFAPK